MNKNFLKGISQGINLFPREREVNVLLPIYSNEEAFKKDIEQVGSDMYFVVKSIEKSKKSYSQNDEQKKDSMRITKPD